LFRRGGGAGEIPSKRLYELYSSYDVYGWYTRVHGQPRRADGESDGAGAQISVRGGGDHERM